MTEYAPDTQDVRHAWSLFWHASINGYKTLDQYEAEFDRWLAQVKAEAWDEGFEGGYFHGAYLKPRPTNPYREETR